MIVRKKIPAFVLVMFVTAIIVGSLGYLATPYTAEAALVPCGEGTRDADGAVTSEDMCTIGDLFLLVQNIINWLLLVMIPLATLSIGIAGGMLIISGGNEERRSQAKEIIKYAVIGLLLALAAWIIVRSLVDFLKSPEAEIIVPLEETT